GRMRVIALIEDGDVSKRILEHLGLQAQVPAPSPVRAPPTPIPSSDAELVCDGIDEHAAPWMNSEPGTDPNLRDSPWWTSCTAGLASRMASSIAARWSATWTYRLRLVPLGSRTRDSGPTRVSLVLIDPRRPVVIWPPTDRQLSRDSGESQGGACISTR